MFVQVKLLAGYTKTLTYKIPESWNTNDLDGSVITVPLKNKIIPALVLKTYANIPEKGTFAIKEAIAKDHLPPDKDYSNFISKISQFYFVHKNLFYQRIRGFVHTKENHEKQIESRNTKLSQVDTTIASITLTKEQQTIVDNLLPIIKQPTYSPTLLHGVTGSGKTEIYKKVIIDAIAQNKSVLLLLPEVSLSLQFQHLLQKQLPTHIPIFGFHSASKAKEKKILWQNLTNKKACLIIGVHLPVILPIPNLGCIIVDEEHESGFQEKKHPKINSKEIATWRAKLYNIPIILGSATPSLNSLYNVKHHSWKLFTLTKRFSGNFPTIKTVQIDGKQKRQNFWITKELQTAIADRLQKKEQILIYLNRRGYSFFIQCKQCGFTFVCPHCSVSLTLHKTNNHQKLCCHYCNYKQANPTACSKCCAPEKELFKRGIGTQQVVTILQQLFPNAHIARADLDTTKKKQSWHQTVEQFENGKIDILVGTQTITKGYHFPKVTLVGILWADLNVHFPIFNASETTLQQLVQVAGRAGRQSTESLVIVQIMHDHPIFKYLKEKQYLDFCNNEMEFRKQTNYPPFGRLVQIELKNINSKEIDTESESLYHQLAEINDNKNLGITILGPAQPLVYRIQKTEIRHIFLKSSNFGKIHQLLNAIDTNNFQSQIFIVPTP